MSDGTATTIDGDHGAGGAPGSSARYELRRQLSASTTGATWRAWDHNAGREVDIRQLRPPEQLAPEQRRAMVARRARAALRAQRVGDVPGLVPVLDVLASDDEVLVVTEVVAGQSLAELLRDQSRLPGDRAAHIAASLATTLAALHEHGLAHGDLRPSRVRIDGEDVRLVAHGLARPGEDEPEATLLASPAYLSPERTSGSRVGPADDVWALGVLLFAMVEGTPPFSGHSVDDLLDAIAHQPAPRPTSAEPQVASAVTAMLDKDPAERPSMTQVRQLLAPPPAALEAEQAVPAGSPTRVAGPPVKPAPAKPATTRSAAPRRCRSASSEREPSHAIPLIGILVVLLVAWFLLSRF